MYMVEYDLGTRKKETLLFTTVRMALKGVVLSAMSPIEKDSYCMNSLMCEIPYIWKEAKLAVTELWLLGAGWGVGDRRKGEMLVKGHTPIR